MANPPPWADSPVRQRLAWQPPKPDPDAALKQEFKNENADRWLSLMRGDAPSGPPPKPFDEWKQEKLAPQREAEREPKEREEDAATAKAARAESAATRAQLATLEKELERREAAVKVAKIDEYCRERGWDARGPKRSRAVSQMSRRGLL
jgi:hypothetical protein